MVYTSTPIGYRGIDSSTANAADLIFLHGSWPVLEVSEAEKDKKRERLISSDRTKIDLIIEISIK